MARPQWWSSRKPWGRRARSPLFAGLDTWLLIKTDFMKGSSCLCEELRERGKSSLRAWLPFLPRDGDAPRNQSASSTEGSAALGVGGEACNEATPNMLPSWNQPSAPLSTTPPPDWTSTRMLQLTDPAAVPTLFSSPVGALSPALSADFWSHIIREASGDTEQKTKPMWRDLSPSPPASSEQEQWVYYLLFCMILPPTPFKY